MAVRVSSYGPDRAKPRTVSLVVAARVACSVSTQLDAGTEGLSYAPKTSELTLSFGEDRPTCAGVVVFDPTGISPPKIREQASSSQTPCGSVPATEVLRIAVALEGSSVVSLTLTDPFGEGPTAIVSYDRDLPEGFTVQAPVNSMDREAVDLRTFAEQVVRNAAVVAVSSTSGAGPESTVDITLEHINDAILGMDLEGYEFKKTEASVVIQALDGPDAGCTVAISPARSSV